MRLDDLTVAELVVYELGDALVPDPDPPPGYAVVVRPGADRPPARPLPQFRRGPATVMRSRDPGRLALALANHVRSHGVTRRATMRLASAAVITDEGAVLLPAEKLWTPGLERQLRAAGYACVDTPTVEIDLVSQRLVGKAWSWARDAVAVDAGVVRWVVARHERDRFPATTAGTTATLAQFIRPTPSADAQTTLASIVELANSVEVVAIPRGEWGIPVTTSGP